MEIHSTKKISFTGKAFAIFLAFVVMASISSCRATDCNCPKFEIECCN